MSAVRDRALPLGGLCLLKRGLPSKRVKPPRPALGPGWPACLLLAAILSVLSCQEKLGVAQ